MLFYENNAIQKLSRLLNEVLFILVPQEAAKLREVKVVGRKKLPYAVLMWVNLLNQT